MKISFGPNFKHIISSLNEIVDNQLTIECKKTGLYCMAHDDATVCLMEVFIHRDFLIEYDVIPGETFTVDMNLFQKIMKTIKYDTLHLTKTKDTLLISSEGNRKCHFELSLLDTMNENMDIPEIDYECIFTIDKTIFQGVCKDLKQFGEEVVLKVVGNEKIIFSTKDEIECKIEVENVEIENEENTKIEKKYDLKYFLKMLKASTLSSNVTFYQSTDMPLVIEYKIDEEGSYIRYYLGNMV